MCVLCTALPTVLLAGVAAHAGQHRARRQAEADGKPAPRPRIPALPATAIGMVGILSFSVWYHAYYGG